MGASEIPDTMKAIQVVEFNKPYKINTVKVPKDLQPTDILVKVAVASNCHTDSMVTAGTFGTKLPCTASHEGAGTIVALGKDAEARGFKVGQRVMCGLPLHPCGECGDCRGPENQTQYCSNLDGHCGVHVDGCFAEYVSVDSHSTTPLPDEVSFTSAAPLACAGRTIWRGLLQTGLKAGEWVAIVGSGGGLGHLGIQFAKALGLKVIGVDARDEGLSLSKEQGADVIVDARKGKESVVKEVHAVTNDKGADSTVCISDHEDAAAIACAVTKMHGIMVQIAQPKDVVIPFEELIFRDIRIHGSLLCSADESKSMLECIAKNGITVKTNPFNGLDKIEELTGMVHGGKIQGKAIIIVDPEQIDHEKKIGVNS
ncbi:GroES-like protein [Microthyrium microscopicum]|uniref:GroES-like protein n=1 Tax=Microthyrium microscopicum TaxID=703497 RepID=A0A6A6UUE8_9PEZI|nr:GroES-like protein [Microthyrium microscopicum]